jgi:hypothetical protein
MEISSWSVCISGMYIHCIKTDSFSFNGKSLYSGVGLQKPTFAEFRLTSIAKDPF